MKKPKPTVPFVEVVWEDAWVSETPVTLERAKETHKPEIITTLGWALVSDEVGISLANEYYEDTFRGRTFIIRRDVLKETVLNVTPKGAKRGAKRIAKPEAVDNLRQGDEAPTPANKPAE